MTHDPVFTQVLETPALASQPSLSRFFHRFDDQAIEQLQAANQALIDQVHRLRKTETLLIDLDSSHAVTYGNQENAAYYTHYGTVEFLRPLLAHYNEVFPETSTLVRGDSGFAVPGLYELCEQESVYYIIRLKSNAKL